MYCLLSYFVKDKPYNKPQFSDLFTKRKSGKQYNVDTLLIEKELNNVGNINNGKHKISF